MAGTGDEAEREARAARDRENKRRWQQENRDRINAARRARRAADPEAARAAANKWNAENRAKVNERERLAAQRRKLKKRQDEQRQERDRERARQWAADNPERLKERRDRWTAANSDRVREHGRNYYARNREEILAKQRERNAANRDDPAKAQAQREYRERNKDRLLEQQRARRSTPEAREAVNRDNRERKRRERRRRELGLPPRTAHRWTKNERLLAQSQASEFFERRMTLERAVILQREMYAVAMATAAAQLRQRREENAKIDRVIERLLYTNERVQSWAAKLRETHLEHVQEDVRMDSIVRVANGKPAYDLEDEAEKRLSNLVADRARADVVRQLRKVQQRAARAPRAVETERAVAKAADSDQAREVAREAVQRLDLGPYTPPAPPPVGLH